MGPPEMERRRLLKLAGLSAGALAATAAVRTPAVARPAAADAYGYLMVHFVEDARGYAEKIYLDVSREDDPEQWDPLNGRQPILASHVSTTGVRDPFLTYDPQTGTYYIIATDLRVFGGDAGSGDCTQWCHWTKSHSTKVNVWTSKDLVGWGGFRQFDVALDPGGRKVAELGMMWAPEATWVPDYHGQGRGAFVMYWSSTVYDSPAHDNPTYPRVLWGATTDFTQDTFEFGGTFVDEGRSTIDTTIVQEGGRTYRITKGADIYMEYTDSPTWWRSATGWTTVQTAIGAEWVADGNPAGVEGPAVFKSNREERWYLYVDVIPTTGYRPMVTTDLDRGWSRLTSPGFSMAPNTKHGGIISLTREQYDAIRAADATSAVSDDLGTVTVAVGTPPEELARALPPAEVELAYDRGTSELPVAWDTAAVDLSAPGTYPVTGTVRSIGANLNQWVGRNGSTAWDAPDKRLYSSTAITVRATVEVRG